MLLVVEDSQTDASLLKHMVANRFPDLEIVVVESLMAAVPYMSRAKAIVFDWILKDGINALNGGALALAEKRGIPRFVLTGDVSSVPVQVNCRVIDKKNRLELVETLAGLDLGK